MSIHREDHKSSHNSGHSIADVKVATVMREFRKKKLRSSSGELVTNPKQALAIGFSESRRAR